MERDQLLEQAEAAERLAALVSFKPDKERLREQAARLRATAARYEERSWQPDLQRARG